MFWSDEDIINWYKNKILEIENHDNKLNKNICKKYICYDELFKMFEYPVIIQEKIRGKLVYESYNYRQAKIIELQQVVSEIKLVDNIPITDKVYLDTIIQLPNTEPFIYKYNYNDMYNNLNYAIVNLEYPTLEQIFNILNAFSNLPSHYEYKSIEGFILKNYTRMPKIDTILDYNTRPKNKIFMAKWFTGD